MTQLRKRDKTKKYAEEVAAEVKEPTSKVPIRFDKVVSTGSTLLDLAVSGGRVRGGGLPPGILVEIYGPEASGKTSLLAEICASAQRKGGQARFRDPEARLDKEYAEYYGVNIGEDFFDYARPDTVEDLFDDIWDWSPEKEDVINVFAADSIAALSTRMEMEEEDKRGQRQAKMLSSGLRKTCKLIAHANKLVIFSNQIRQGEMTEITPGGKAIPFYASLRIRVGQKSMIEREAKLESGKVIKKVIGIESSCYIRKSTIDDPYRTANISILFNYGLDDVRQNLQFIKDMTKDTQYDCFDKKYQAMERAIQYIEENKAQRKLRNAVIDLWTEIEKKFELKRTPKVRF